MTAKKIYRITGFRGVHTAESNQGIVMSEKKRYCDRDSDSMNSLRAALDSCSDKSKLGIKILESTEQESSDEP